MRLKMPRDRIRQRTVLDPGARMYNHSGRFINHGEELILEKDIERNILGLEFRNRNFSEVDIDLIAIAKLVRRLHFFLIYKYVPAFDQPLQSRTRPAFDLFGNKRVETFARIRG